MFSVSQWALSVLVLAHLAAAAHDNPGAQQGSEKGAPHQFPPHLASDYALTPDEQEDLRKQTRLELKSLSEDKLCEEPGCLFLACNACYIHKSPKSDECTKCKTFTHWVADGKIQNNDDGRKTCATCKCTGKVRRTPAPGPEQIAERIDWLTEEANSTHVIASEKIKKTIEILNQGPNVVRFGAAIILQEISRHNSFGIQPEEWLKQYGQATKLVSDDGSTISWTDENKAAYEELLDLYRTKIRDIQGDLMELKLRQKSEKRRLASTAPPHRGSSHTTLICMSSMFLLFMALAQRWAAEHF